MLSLLHIENIAIIESADISFDSGFNVLTGETGAGKSIVIDSINAVLGERVSRDLVRAGSGQAAVSAVFSDLSAAADKRFELLECTLREMFPAIRGITPEYVFAARDGRTPDGLPVIGRLPQKKNKEAASHVAYAFCCGDNGILHAEIASRLLLEQVQGKDNHQLGLFSPNRHWRIKR